MTSSLLPNIIQFISQIGPFDKIPKSALKHLASQVKIIYLARGEQIVPSEKEEDRYLYIVRTGSMEQRKANGVLRARLGDEDLFGFTFLESEVADNESYTTTAIENSLLYLIPHSALQNLFKEHPESAEHFASQAQVRLKSALDVVWSNKEKGVFIKKVEEVASRRIAIANSNQSIQEVANLMISQSSPCAVVFEDEKIVGLITDRDMTKRVIAQQVSTNNPVSEVMTLSPKMVAPDDLVMHAALIMMQYNIRNLPVVKDNKAVGLLTTTNLVQNHRVQAIFLIEKIKHAKQLETLVGFTPERQAIFEALIEGHVTPEGTGKVMTMVMDAYNKKLIQMAIDELGPPPCDFSWIAAGSHARNEVHMLSDQDSVIVLEDNATEEDKAYFHKLAEFVTNGLDACGYPLCTGHFMAVVPKWCQPLSVWKRYYKKWVSSPEYKQLLNISVFLEIRTVYGNENFETILRDELHRNISKNSHFLSSLVNDAVNVTPPLGIFNSLVLEKSGNNKRTLNIKKYAITLIIDLARIYGLAAKCSSSSTHERFKAAFEKEILSEDSTKNILGAYQFILSFRFSHQLEALRKAEVPNNHIDPNTFSSFERSHLKDAFRIIADLQDVTKIKFGAPK